MSKISAFTKDKAGNYTGEKLKNTLWMHSGNNKLYVIIGFVWHGDTDLWHIKYKEYQSSNDVEFTRSIENFEGMRGDQKRFIRIVRDDLDQEQDE